MWVGLREMTDQGAVGRRIRVQQQWSVAGDQTARRHRHQGGEARRSHLRVQNLDTIVIEVGGDIHRLRLRSISTNSGWKSDARKGSIQTESARPIPNLTPGPSAPASAPS